jgi:hypothetical protein
MYLTYIMLTIIHLLDCPLLHLSFLMIKTLKCLFVCHFLFVVVYVSFRLQSLYPPFLF